MYQSKTNNDKEKLYISDTEYGLLSARQKMAYESYIRETPRQISDFSFRGQPVKDVAEFILK